MSDLMVFQIPLGLFLLFSKVVLKDSDLALFNRKTACRIQNSGKFCPWNPESSALEFRIELKYSEIPLRNGIQNPRSTEKDWNPAPGNRNPRNGIQNPRLPCIPYHWNIPLIRSPHFRTNLKTFVKEISIRRFLPRTFSSNWEWSALDFTLLGTVRSPRLHLYHS